MEQSLDHPKKMKEYDEFQSQYIHLDGYTFEHHMEGHSARVRLKFNFEKTRSLNSLSEGQKNKVALAILFL